MVHFKIRSKEFFANIFSCIFIKCDITATGRLHIGVIMADLRSIGISPVFRETLYSSWRGWARLLLHCLRISAGNAAGPSEEFC